MSTFEKGDEVYTQDGQKYYFDHAAGDHGYVSPFILMQAINHRGDDFEEFEEPANHTIPIRLDQLSKTPWLRVVDEETKRMLAEREAQLEELRQQIGAARIAKTMMERELSDTEKTFQKDWWALQHRYDFVRTFAHLTGDKPAYMLSWGDKPTHRPSKFNPREIKLRRKSWDSGVWEFVAEYDEGDDTLEVFKTEGEMNAAVVSKFLKVQDQLSPADELTWKKAWPMVVLSDAAEEHQVALEAAEHEKKLTRARQRLEDAQAELAQLEGDKDA